MDRRVEVRPLGDRLALRRRGEHVDVLLGNVVLLSSAALETERAFGALAAELTEDPAARVLVGGLGFGATVRGALDALGPEAKVVVVEKLAPIAELVRGELAHLAGDVLADPRVELVMGDVSDAIARARGLGAILLDVDNGPDWASFRTNARLYAREGVKAASSALAPGGVIAVWSGYAADRFLAELRAAGLLASVVPLRERGAVRARAYVGRSARAKGAP